MDDTPGVLAGECQLGTLNTVSSAYASQGGGRSRPKPAKCGSHQAVEVWQSPVNGHTWEVCGCADSIWPPFPPLPSSARSGKPRSHGC